MDLALTKEDWEANIERNEILIKQNLMQIEMAKAVIKLCKRKAGKFQEAKEKI